MEEFPPLPHCRHGGTLAGRTSNSESGKASSAKAWSLGQDELCTRKLLWGRPWGTMHDWMIETGPSSAIDYLPCLGKPCLMK